MWSQLFLCCLIGFAAASQNGWQSNMEYTYKVQGRTLTALHEVGNQYSGIVMKAKLVVRPESQESLMAKIVKAQYSQVHTDLPEGWKSEIPVQKLQFKQLELSEKPFQILLKNGVVRDVIVDREVHNWEANIIKSIVSQVQLDVQGEHLIESHVNQLPEGDFNSAVFKTMEDTITGTYETLYDIAPLPEHILQSQPELVPMPELQKDGEVIEIVKNKNFSNGEERLSYYYGLGEMGQFEPATNQMKDFLLRNAISRVIVTGNLKRYTIQSAITTNKIILRPTLNSEEHGMVVSHLNLTLAEMKPTTESFEQPQQGQKLGSLTYTFNTPFSGNYEARQGAQRKDQRNLFSSEERQFTRHPRSIRQHFDSVESSEEWMQEDSKLNQAPQSPLLPLTIGYKGKSIKNSDKVDVIEVAQKIAQQIAKEIEQPEHIPKKRTLARYVILTSVVRLMNEKEMQHVADKLFTKQEEGHQAQAWKVFRDAVSEAGTGPALLMIQDWIKTKKIQSEEAAEIVARMAESVRQPTEEYMRNFYNLATKEEQVRRQAILNDTALLSYTNLVRKVYVDKLVSHNQFPVHVFGTFRTEKGQEFVAEELIPHLKEQLEQSIQHADSHKILVYIRALGNVAHQKILAVFKPYLEGEKQVSQFQRLQMVVALDKLARTHPKVARSVLYKIYQNAGDLQEIRVAAVFQLMRTVPSAALLQRMAQYTNVDEAEQVNAAVKSAIETAAQLEGEEFAHAAENARSAQPLLTKKVYGIHYSQDALRSYVENEMNLYYKQQIHTFGSQDSFIPKGIHYALRAGLGGAKRQLCRVQAMVSSIDELTNVFQRQFEHYNKKQEQQQQNYQQAKSQQWTSEFIADKLNMKRNEREQLEGNLLIELANGVTRYFTLNNQTLEMLPEVLRDVEKILREGQQFQYTKFVNRFDVAISFPTEMALPFLYTIDAPTMMHFHGKLRATSEPMMSNGEVIRKPDTITAFAEVRAVLSTRLQTKLGFVTPFDHQEYVAGYDKNVQINLPIKSEMEIDLKQQEMTVKIQPMEQDMDTKVLHYSTWPYTAQRDLLRMIPIGEETHHKIIYTQDKPQTQFNQIVGKHMGFAFHVEYNSEQKFADSLWIFQQLKRHDAISALLAPIYDETIQYTELNVKYVPQESTARKVLFRLGYDSKFEQEERQDNVEITDLKNLSHDSKDRKQRMAKMVSSGIASSQAHVVDLEIEVDGQNKRQYIATAAIATSQVSEKARFIVYVKQQGARNFEVALKAKAVVPNTNGLDFLYALKFDPTSTVEAELAFGEDLTNANKIQLHAKLHKSEARKQYLKNYLRAEECHDEMKQGNRQLSNCANMTAEANLMDRITVRVEFEHLNKQVRNITHKLYNGLRYLGYFNLDENVIDANTNQKENQMTLEARFEPDFEAVNVTLKTHKMETHLNRIRVGQWAKRVVAIHPVFRMHTRTMGYALGLDTYRHICVVDKTATKTFDNKTYQMDLRNDWTVMMQYVPQFAREGRHHQQYQQQQEKLQLDQYVVLVRDANNGEQKEVKMTIRTPETQGQVIEIDLKPVQGNRDQQAAKVIVNGNEIQYNMKQSHEIKHGLIKIYGIQNGEVKIVVDRAFYIIYDGERVKLTATHDKLRDSVRGLCGTFDGEQTTDFVAPHNCILEHPEDLVAAYQVEKTSERQGRYNYRHGQRECVERQIKYVKVISEIDMGRTQARDDLRSTNQHWNRQQESSCMTHQTRYEVRDSDNEICFTVRPLPVCRQTCGIERTHEKNVDVHCVQRTTVAEKWAQQIDNGASPDFSHKPVTKTIKMQVHDSCTRY